jgi:hypothetical protein
MVDEPKYAVGLMSVEDYATIKTEIDAQTDRGAAVIAGSLLDEHLRWAIDCKFIELSASTKKRIFEGVGPLSNFEGRRLIGFALGLYDRDAREELKTIGEIRNRFAHTVAPIDFRDGIVVGKCDRLIYPKLHTVAIGSTAPNREKYLHSCWILRALVTSQVTVEGKPSGPNHENLLEALAESLAGSLPHDKSAELHPSPIQTDNRRPIVK